MAATYNDQEYASGSLSASDDAVPSRITVEPTATFRSGPAFATGGTLRVSMTTVSGAESSEPVIDNQLRHIGCQACPRMKLGVAVFGVRDPRECFPQGVR